MYAIDRERRDRIVRHKKVRSEAETQFLWGREVCRTGGYDGSLGGAGNAGWVWQRSLGYDLPGNAAECRAVFEDLPMRWYTDPQTGARFPVRQAGWRGSRVHNHGTGE